MTKKILKISENVLGENDIYTANICHNLAYIYGEEGEYEKAKAVWCDIIEQLEKMGLDIEMKFVKERLQVCKYQIM